MATCIHCGKSGKKVCDTCLEKAKKGKLTFIFPLKNNETTITDACKPKPTPAKVVISTQTPQSSDTAIEKVVPKAIVEKEDPESTMQVESEPKTMAPAAKINTLEEFINAINKQREESQATPIQNPPSSANKTQPEVNSTTTNTTNGYAPDNDDKLLRDIDTTTSSSGSGCWWLVLCVLAGVVLTCFLVPWNIGQWIGGITAGLLILFVFIIGVVEFYDASIIHDILLYICTAINIGLTVWLKSNYSMFSFVISIAMVVSSFIVMVGAYRERERKEGHWALLCLLINIAVIFWDKVYFYIEQFLSYVNGF